VEDLVEEALDGFAGDGAGAGEEFVEEDAVGVDVDALGGGVAHDLLGRHVVGGADLEAGFGEVEVLAFGDAEVHEADAAGGVDVEVVGLDVAVDELLLMDVGEGAGALGGDAHAGLEVGQGGVADGVAEVGAGEELHDDVGFGVLLAVVEDADDVVVDEGGRHFGLGEEAGTGFGVGGALGGEDLDADDAVEDGVAGFEDVRHAAAEELLKLVLAELCWKLHGWRAARAGPIRATVACQGLRCMRTRP